MADTRSTARAVVALAFLLLAPSVAGAQMALGDGGSASEIVRRGSARVLETAGPALSGRREFYRPVPPLRLRHRWILVQDSTTGVVFGDATGVKAGLDGYESDVHLRALHAIMAVELRSLVFSVWGDPAGYFSATALDERGADAAWELHPRWRGSPVARREHRTSITWVHRVMFDDESVVEADLTAVGAAWSFVTGKEFTGLPDEMLERADGL